MSAKDAENSSVEQSEAPSPGPSGAIAKLLAPVAYARAHARIAIAAAVVLLLGIGALVGWIMTRPSPSQLTSRVAEAAVEALDEDDLDEAKKRAQDVCRQTDLAEPLALANFVLGVAGAKEADKAAPAVRGPMFLAAAQYLKDALAGGLPEDRADEAKWLLGRSLCEAGQVEDGRKVFDETLEVQPQRAAQIRQLLAAAYLREYPPKLAQALVQNKLYLATEGLASNLRQEGLLQQAEILVAMGKSAESLGVLAKIGIDAKYYPAASVVEGRALLAEGRELKAKATSAASRRQADEKYHAALTALRRQRGVDPAYTQSGRQSLYLTGVCLLEMGDAQAALAQFRELHTLDPAQPEYFAAAFQEATLLQSMGRAAEAVSEYCRALDAARGADEFRNPWVTVEQVRKGVLEAYQQNLEAHKYTAAMELARRPGVVVPIERSLQMQAEICRAWGRDLLNQAEAADTAKAAALVRDGRAQLRRSSRFWQQLAKRRIATRFYPEDLWESAACALDGHDYRDATTLLNEYLAQDSRVRQPKALAALGEAMLSLDRIDEALDAFRKCIDRYPRDVASLRARLLAAQTYGEKGDLTNAQRLLEENLSGDSLTPASREYRESLLALSQLLYRTKRYDEAIGRLEESVSRYPDLRQTIEARYLIADCHRQKALGERERLKHDLVEQSRGARVQRIHSELASSLEWYRQSQQTLLKRQETTPLNALEKAMLRNSYYLIGSVLFDQGQFDAAIQAYARAVSRYPSAPETLEAHVQMARAFRAINKSSEARGMIEQAKNLLTRIKTETLLRQTTNYSKAQWTALLDKLSAM